MAEKIIQLAGVWQNDQTKELFRITGPNGSDLYKFESNFNKGKFTKHWEAFVFFTDSKHGRLKNLLNNNNVDLWINDHHSFSIKNSTYIRITDEKILKQLDHL